MEALVSRIKEEKDSIGGIVSCVCRHIPTGWGEPVFDKMEARLAQAMLSIPATKGFEIGSGFTGTRLKGSVHNDPFEAVDGRLGTVSNNSGGIQGGTVIGKTDKAAAEPTDTPVSPQDFNATVAAAMGLSHEANDMQSQAEVLTTLAVFPQRDQRIEQLFVHDIGQTASAVGHRQQASFLGIAERDVYFTLRRTQADRIVDQLIQGLCNQVGCAANLPALLRQIEVDGP